MTENTEKFVRALLLPINPAVVVLLGIYTTLWGFWVANPWWTVFTQAQLFSALETAWFIQVLPFSAEVFWGGIAIICGLFIIHGAMRRSYSSLIRGATIAFFHWGVIALFYFMGDWTNTGGITALLMCTYGAFLFLNIRVNFKERKEINDVLR